MNSYERVITALKGNEPDRVPTFEWSIDPTVRKGICGKDISEEDFIEKMDIDAVIVSPVTKITQIGPNHFIDEWGVEKKAVHIDPLPMAIGAPIKKKSDLKRYSVPDPLAPYRMDKLRLIMKRFKGKKAIVFQARDVFSCPRDLLGFEGLLINLIDDPGFVRDLVEISLDYNSRLCLWAAREGADVVFTGDDIADNRGPLFSPKLFQDVFLPGFKAFVRTLKEAGVFYIKHTDGNVWPLIDFLVKAGIDCLDPIEAPAGMDIGEVKKKYGNKIAIKGNIDCRKTLTVGSEEQVIDEVKNCIRIASPGGGHIISSSNSIHSGVNPINYVTMLNAIKKFGVYPIDFDVLKR